MSLENKTIADLASLSSTTISDNDLVLFVDLKTNETKNIRADEFSQYNITSSGILVSLISGSFTGSFTGSLNGLIVSSSYASSASLSLTSSNLFYNGLYNGTASYSMNSAVSEYSLTSSYSLSSSYASTSSYSTTSSYSFTTGSTNSIYNSGISDYSLNSLESYTSSYIKYDGQNNGTVFRSITSERSNYCITASNLLDDNTTITLASFTSSFAQSSITSSYIVSASWSNFSETSSLGSDIVFSYVRFRLQSANIKGKFEVIPESWYNVTNIGMSPNPLYNNKNSYDILFDIKFKDPAKRSIGNQNSCLSNFKPTVISNFQFGNTNEVEYTGQYAAGDRNGHPYYFNFNGYSCTDSGFVLKLTVVLFDMDDDVFKTQTLGLYAKGEYPGTAVDTLATDILEGSVFTGIVYIDPRGIDVNTPNTIIPPFVDHTLSC